MDLDEFWSQIDVPREIRVLKQLKYEGRWSTWIRLTASLVLHDDPRLHAMARKQAAAQAHRLMQVADDMRFPEADRSLARALADRAMKKDWAPWSNDGPGLTSPLESSPTTADAHHLAS